VTAVHVYFFSPFLQCFSHVFGAHFSCVQHAHALSAHVQSPPAQHAQPSTQQAIGHAFAGALSTAEAGAAAPANARIQNRESARAMRFMIVSPLPVIEVACRWPEDQIRSTAARIAWRPRLLTNSLAGRASSRRAASAAARG